MNANLLSPPQPWLALGARFSILPGAEIINRAIARVGVGSPPLVTTLRRRRLLIATGAWIIGRLAPARAPTSTGRLAIRFFPPWIQIPRTKASKKWIAPPSLS